MKTGQGHLATERSLIIVVKKLSLFCFKILSFLDKIFNIITKRSILVWFKEFIQNESYKKIQILNQKINFFIPNQLVEWRVDTFHTKEPETLEWIDTFDKSGDFIFWDIGANIGLYSIYNSLKHKKSQTISFEPSTSNLRVLSRNISINNLFDRIKIFTVPLTKGENKFLIMKEGEFQEGGALNSFGENFDFEGKKFLPKMNYQIYGTNINYLIGNKILDIPDYIKIDVDGIEHLILEGGNKYLNNKKIKSLSIEINENFTKQHEKVIEIMKKNDFKILHKKRNEDLFKNDPYSKFNRTFNYIFIR
jgi:FkbM family methyltransferase